MSTDPSRPHLRIVDHSAPVPPRDRPRSMPVAPAAPSLLERIIAASEPGDVEALLTGLIVGVLLVAVLVLAANATLIEAWLLG